MSVVNVSISRSHNFTKTPKSSITLIAGEGVEGDCHSGPKVQHRSRLHIKPTPANLRQVHLMHKEILDEFDVKPSDLGENITTQGLDLLGLSEGTRLHFVSVDGKKDAVNAVVRVTGLRNPCPQIDKFRKGLQEKFIVRDTDRKILGRKAGIMSVVEVGGAVNRGMKILVVKPKAHKALEAV